MAPRAFISFEMEDRWARNFLAQQAKDKRNDIEFVDYSVQDPFDSSWKTQCSVRMGQTKGTIVLIGPTTYLSNAVLWEIKETAKLGNHLFAVQINRDQTHAIPEGIPASSVIRWNFDQIIEWLATWV